MSSFGTYDPAKTIITVGGAIISGFADGTFVKVARDEAAFVKYIGADGTGARSKTNNRGGQISITLHQSSPSNDVLSALALRDELRGDGVVPVGVKDVSGTSLAFANQGWVMKLPDAENGKEIAEREWVIDCADLTMFVGGSTVAGLLNGILPA